MKVRLLRTVLPRLPALQPASKSASADRGHEDASGARQQVQTSACCMPVIQNMSLPGILPAVAAADGDVSLPCCCSHLTEELSRSCCGSVSFCGCSFPAFAGLGPACWFEMRQQKLGSMTCKSLLLSGDGLNTGCLCLTALTSFGRPQIIRAIFPPGACVECSHAGLVLPCCS